MQRSTTTLYHQILIMIPVAYNKFSIGLAIGWLAPTLKSLDTARSEIPLDIHTASWIASLHELGRLLGSLLTIFMTGRIERKRILVYSTLIFFCTWFGIYLTKSVPILYITRIVFGIGVGMYDVISPVHLGENCSSKFKDRFIKVIELSFYSGILMQFIMASYLSYNTVALINLAIGLLGVLITVFLKPSVHYLLGKAKLTDARKNSVWFKSEFYWDETGNTADDAEEQKPYYEGFSNLITRNNYKNVILMLFLYSSAAALGYNAIISYATIIFSNTKFSSNEFTVYFGVILWIAVCISFPIRNRYAFKSQLLVLISFYCLSILHICSAFLYYNSLTELSIWYPMLAFFFVSFSSLVYIVLNFALYGVNEQVFFESFETPGASLIVAVQSCVSFVIIKIFLIVGAYYGFHVIFSVFAILSLVMFLFTFVVFFSSRSTNEESIGE